MGGMESKAKLAGHPIHPMLVVFPLGLLISAVIFDVVFLATGRSGFALVSFWNIAVGVLGGLTAAVFGLVDWLAIPKGTRAKTIGLWHGAINVVVVALFALSWLFRFSDPMRLPTTAAFILGLVAIGFGTVSGWLGGELVDRLGVGVDPGAHLNSPSSLTKLPASDQGLPPPPIGKKATDTL
jgi:uncharacterized membrane protein